MTSQSEPDRDCPLCPRLVEFRETYRTSNPEWHNAPVPTFASGRVRLLIVGLAPGLRGANKTGRPFTGDFAGDLLYETLGDFGFAKGTYAATPNDGVTLVDAAITNAVRCVPPQNKPVGAEIRSCLPFLTATIAGYRDLVAILALGRIAHDATLSALALKKSTFPFAHGVRHAPEGGPVVFDSYHCSRYNTNTGRLTRDMFRGVFEQLRAEIDRADRD